MSNAVIYCLFVPGERFNARLPEGIRANSGELKSLKESGLEFEFRWPHAGEQIAAQLTGSVTLLWTMWRYAALLRGTKEVVDQLTAWEKSLKAMFPGVKIYRLIEILYDEFEADNGERWFDDTKLISKFEQWLQTQDPSDWGKIADEAQTR
jgi:hypothetical protein